MGDQQEIHFFDNDAMFVSGVDYEELHKHYPLVASSTIAGDCTPSYLYHEPAAERISKYNPKIRLLIILRNPVERAFAHWNMQRFKGREPLDFFDAVREEQTRISGAPPADSRLLWTATCPFVQILSARASEGREVRKVQGEPAQDPRFHLFLP
jgi:hypothetical protein